MRRALTGALSAALACVAVAVAVAVAAPARADYGTVTRVTLTSAKNFYPGATTLLVSRTVTLAAGESRHVRGRLEATSSTTAIVAMDDIVKCVDSTGATVGITSASARNHEGYDTTYYAIDGHLPMYADLLFTAPSAGTYTCGVYGWTASSNVTDYHLTAVADSTWLEIGNSNQPGSHWWQNPACDSHGTYSTCTYVGAGTSTAWVFYTDGTPVYKWLAASNATAVQALANITVTTCYSGTASCKDSIAGYEKPRGTNSVVDFRYEVIQLDTTAHTCRLTSTTTSRRTIRDDAHHYTAYFSLTNIPIDSSCGTRYFIMRIYVTYVSGNPIKIDGVQGTTSLTNGIAMNLF